MITKGIIEKIEWTNFSDSTSKAYLVTVRLPFLNTTQEAIVCTLPKCNFIPEIGDIVFVTFEDYDINKPVTISCLFKESGNTSNIELDLNSLNVNGLTKLSNMTSVGDVDYEQIKYLIGLKQNLQATIDDFENRIKKLEDNN